MSTVYEDVPHARVSIYRAIVMSGIAAGVLDISSAFVNGGIHGRTPIWVLQSVAAGFLGSESFKNGIPSAVLGLTTHFFIAFVWATVFVLARQRFEVLGRHPIVGGFAYGIIVYSCMYMVVLPLTFKRSFLTPLSAVITAVLIHMFCVGLPISLVSYWVMKGREVES